MLKKHADARRVDKMINFQLSLGSALKRTPRTRALSKLLKKAVLPQPKPKIS